VRTIHAFARGFTRAYDRLGIRGTPVAKRVGSTIDAIARASVLPAPLDVDAILPPTRRVLVRKVVGTTLWIWYTATDTDVWLSALTDYPPP
jgi:hypothetical protein